MTQLVTKKSRNNRPSTPRFNIVEQPDAIAFTIRPQTVALERARQNVKAKADVQRKTKVKAKQNRKAYPFLANVSDKIAANYDPEAWRENSPTISQGDTQDMKRKAGILISADDLAGKVDLANNLSSFYTNLGQPLPVINKEAVLRSPSKGAGIVESAINYGTTSPSMLAIQGATTLGNGSGIIGATREAWNTGSNLLSKTAGVAGSLVARNPGTTATIGLTALPSNTTGNSSSLGKTLGAVAVGLSPEILGLTYKGLQKIPYLGKFLPSELNLPKIGRGLKKAATWHYGVVPRGLGFGTYSLINFDTKAEMDPSEMGQTVQISNTTTPSITNVPQDSVTLDDGTRLKLQSSLPE